MTEGAAGVRLDPAPIRSSSHPLREYAVLADGERAALVGPSGDIVFLCFPRWHDDAIFSHLLGGDGLYAVGPAQPHYVWGGHYEPGGLIWRSRWVSGDSIVECREALAFPGEPGRVVILRRIEAVRGNARLRIVVDARAGFGREPMSLRPDGATGDDCWSGHSGSVHLRWTGAPVQHVREAADGGLVLEIEVDEGGRHDLVLEMSTSRRTDPPPDPDRAWAATEQAWCARTPAQMDSIAPADAEHAVAVLHGLTSGTGGMVAAATTSLPERAEQGRDYDYRYAWIRDQCFTGHAAAVAGEGALLHSAVSFVADRLLADGEHLRPAYTVDGGPVPSSRSLPLPGYPGAPDVGVGNGAGEQFQLDAFGEALLLFAAADRLGALDADGMRAADAAVRAITRRHDEPDGGVWELSPKRWTHSQLICAAGLRAYAARRRSGQRAPLHLAEQLVDRATRESLHHTGRWQRAPDDPRVDAALLLPALRGAVPPEDPRSVATWRAVVEDLTDEGYVYRFRQEGGALGEAEGAFLLCGFHLALSSHQQGDTVGAARWFERSRAAVGPPAIFTEEFDVGQRQLRGNLPQAFVHALLLETAHTLALPACPLKGASR